MEATLKNDYLLIVLYLMTYLANKRQGILDDIKLPMVHNPNALKDVVAYIKREYNVDIYAVANTEDIIYAETVLGEYLSSLTKTQDSNSSYDEMLLLRDSIDITKDQLSNCMYHIENGVLELFKSINIPNPKLVGSWFNSPDFARYFKIEESENIIATRVVNVNGVRKILFYHMQVHRNRERVISYDVTNALLVSYSLFRDLLSSPIRLYLYLLDQYGINITIGRETKKLFYKKEFKRGETIKLEYRPQKLYYSMQRYKTKNGSEYMTFVQAFDCSLYAKDYLSNKI